MTTKFTTPPAVQNPGAKPDGQQTSQSTVRMGDWVAQDMAYKQSQPLPISDGGKGVSN
jgi:hypothetical protein